MASLDKKEGGAFLFFILEHLTTVIKFLKTHTAHHIYFYFIHVNNH